MSYTIPVKKYISYALGQDEALLIKSVVGEALSNHDEVMIDFEGVMGFTPHFFNLSLCSLLSDMTIDRYLKSVKVTNLSEIGKVAYNVSLTNARSYYSTRNSKESCNMNTENTDIQEKLNQLDKDLQMAYDLRSRNPSLAKETDSLIDRILEQKAALTTCEDCQIK